MLILTRNPTEGVVLENQFYVVYMGKVNNHFVFEVKDWATRKHLTYIQVKLKEFADLPLATRVMPTLQSGKQLKMGFDAPKSVHIARDELLDPNIRTRRAG
jgi:sRNA-binding carbon storage regulator CsrA